MKTIAICRDTVEADIMRCHLSECGINARVLQKSEVSYLSSYLEAYSTFLVVEDDDYIKACEVLGTEPTRIRCPRCGSDNVIETSNDDTPFYKRWTRYILHPSRVYLSCNDCHNTFHIES